MCTKTELFTEKPCVQGRMAKEIAVYDLLDQLRIAYTGVDHKEAASIEDCQNADKILGIKICKNLFLCNTQKTAFYLLMMPGDKKFRTKDLSKQIGSARLSFADEKYMKAFLHITPGSVSVMGLMNDHENRVKLLVDKDVLQDTYIGCHPCINTSSIKIRCSDLIEKFLPYVHHDYTIVEL